MKIRVDKKENVLFLAKILATILVAFLLWLISCYGDKKAGNPETPVLAIILVMLNYFLIIALMMFFNKIFLVGYLKGNGVEISDNQFPDFYKIYCGMGEQLGIKKLPPLFLIQQGGNLNAFAIRFSGKNYIALYSDLFEVIENDVDVVKFVVAHELGHVKRHHMTKQFWTIFGSLIPFLGPAYSRSCEYTCDNIGTDLSENGAEKGLLVLAAGKKLYGKVNPDKYLERARCNRSFSVTLSESLSSHPYLPNRIRNVRKAAETVNYEL